MRAITVGLLLCLVTGCQRAETPEQARSRMAAETDSARAEITVWMRNFERLLAAGQVDSLATMVTDDYQALAPNQPTVAGKAKWVDWTRTLVTQGRWIEQLTSEALEVNGSLAVQRGRYTLRFEPGAAAPRGAAALSDSGKFLWHWRKGGRPVGPRGGGVEQRPASQALAGLGAPKRDAKLSSNTEMELPGASTCGRAATPRNCCTRARSSFPSR